MTPNDTPPIHIRRASVDDQETIRRMVFDAELDPTSLHWSQFMVAETDSGEIVGAGQIRPRGHELGSIVVLPTYRNQGIAGRIITALLADETDVVYLECEKHMRGYYARFGFEEIAWWRAPFPLNVKHVYLKMRYWWSGYRFAVMKRPAQSR
jgi:amino-acid N-acetyltransferase